MARILVTGGGLVGRQVVAVVNIPPKRVAGVKSEVLVLRAVAVAVVGDRLVLVLSRRLLVYGLDGRLLDTLAVALPDPLVDVTGSEGRLVLLTATRLYDAGMLP